MTTDSQPTNEAFDRFRKLTQMVVTTPKAKVDALAKRQARAKQRTQKPA